MDIDELIDDLERLKKENEDLKQQVKAANNTLRRAKDISPIERPSFKRVIKLVADACMTLERVGSGWLLKLGSRVRRFKRLSQIWELLLGDDWTLSEIFPPAPHHHYPQCALTLLPILKKRNPCIAPSYGPSDRTFVPSTE